MAGKKHEAQHKDELLHFLDDINPSRTSRALRNILIDYMSTQKDCLPVDFDLYLVDIRLLFDLLDQLQKNRTTKHIT